MDTTMQSPIRWKIPIPEVVEGGLDRSDGPQNVDVPIPSGPHTYYNKTWVGRVSDGVTPRQAFDALSGHATPLQGGVPSVDGGTVDIPILGKVRQIVDPDRMTIVNTTEPDHVLYPGNVHRSIVQEGDDLYAVTRGYGTGIFPSLNERGAPHVWTYEDRNIRRELNALPQYTPDMEYSPSSYSYENPPSSASTTQSVPAFSPARLSAVSTNAGSASPQSLFTQLMSTGPASRNDPRFSPVSPQQAAALLWPSQSPSAPQGLPPLHSDETTSAANDQEQRSLGRRTYSLSDPLPFPQRLPVADAPASPDGSLTLNGAYLEYLRRLSGN